MKKSAMILGAVVLAFLLIPAMLVLGLSAYAEDDVAEYITFKYDSFNSDDNRLLFNGNTAVVGERLRLTPAIANRGGTVFNRERVMLKDDRSFSTYFSFGISNSRAWDGGSRGGDGIVFTVQTFDNTTSAIGGSLGYADIKQSIGIKFDTWRNAEHGELSDNHIAILQNGTLNPPLSYLDLPRTELDLMTGIIHVWVDYDGPNGVIEVRLNKGSNVRPTEPLMRLTLDESERLTNILDSDHAYIGFTATTGGSYQNHDILNWYFTNQFDPIDVVNKDYLQAPAAYVIEANDLDNGTVELTIQAIGDNVANVPIAIAATNGAILDNAEAITDNDGRAVVIVSSPDGSMIASEVAIEGPGGATASREVTIRGQTAAPLPAHIVANATDQEITVTGVPVGSDVTVYDHVNSVIAARAGVTDGEAVFTLLTGLATGQPIFVTFKLPLYAESERTAAMPKIRSAMLDEADVAVNATTDEAAIRDVPPGAVIRVYDAIGGELLGERANSGATAADLRFTLAPGVHDHQEVYVTIQKPDELESEALKVTAAYEVSQAPEDVEANAETDEVKVGAVPPGATVRIYDGDDNLIGIAANEAAEAAAVVIDLQPYDLQRHETVYASLQEPLKRESGRTPSIAIGKSDMLGADQAAADGTAGEVTVREVPAGATIVVYDEDGLELGRAVQSGTDTTVVIDGLDLAFDQNVRVAIVEVGSMESDPLSVAVVFAPSAPPGGIDANATTNIVTVQGVPAGATVTVYDAEGQVLKTEVNGGVDGTVAIEIDAPGLAHLQEIEVTITEVKKTESAPVSAVAYYEQSRAPLPEDVRDIEADPDTETTTITMINVPAGATVIIYASGEDGDGTEMGRGTEGDLTAGETQVAINSVSFTHFSVAYEELDKAVSDRLTVDIEAQTGQMLDEAIRELEIGYAEGDTWESVTLPLLVMTVGKHDAAVAWTSAKPHAVEITEPAGHTITALVHRQEADESVILTARVSKNGMTKTRTFLVIVKAAGLTKTEIRGVRTVELTGGVDGELVSPLNMDRIIMSNGTKIDKVILDETKASEFIGDAGTAGTVSSIYINTDSADEADEMAVEIPAASLHLLLLNGNSMDIRTDYGSLSLANNVMENMADNYLDLFFRIVPLKNPDQLKAINEQVAYDEAVRSEAGARMAETIGFSLQIESNYENFPTTLFIPFGMNGIDVPEQKVDAWLDSLRIFIVHSDGTKAVMTGMAVNDADGNPAGLSIEVDKFSTFTIIQLRDRYAGGFPLPVTPGTSEPAETDQIISAVIGPNQRAIILELNSDDYVIDPQGFAAMINGISPEIEEVTVAASQVTIRLKDRLPEGYPVFLSYAPDEAGQGKLLHLFADLVIVNPGFHATYINGFPDGTFRPEQPITRAEMAAILARTMNLAGSDNVQRLYSDVSDTHWAVGYIEQLKQLDMLIGDGQGRFRPSAEMTRAEMAMIAARWLQVDLQSSALQPFADVPDGHWASAAIAAALEAGVMIGYADGAFGADRPVTRAQAVAIMNRLMGRMPFAAAIATWPDVPGEHWAYGHIEEASHDHWYVYERGGEETWFFVQH